MCEENKQKTFSSFKEIDEVCDIFGLIIFLLRLNLKEVNNLLHLLFV